MFGSLCCCSVSPLLVPALFALTMAGFGILEVFKPAPLLLTGVDFGAVVTGMRVPDDSSSPSSPLKRT